MGMPRKEKVRMSEYYAALEEAFLAYRQDLDNYVKKSSPMEGILGFGRSLKDDFCHDRFDERVEQIVSRMSEEGPSPEETERFVRRILLQEGSEPIQWPLAAEWMLCALERHSLPLIPFLSKESAAAIRREYEKRNKPWNRLPVQKEICQALKKRCTE